MAGKRDKSANLRSDCKIENSPHREEIERRIMNFEPLRSIAEDYPGFSVMAVQRFAQRHNLMEKRHRDRERILKLIVERGMAPNVPVDSKTAIKAIELLMKKHREIDSSTNVNVQVVTPEQINERINRANRLHPSILSDG